MGQGGSAGTVHPSHCGYHVLKMHPKSPAEKAGLIPFFDFILEANGVAFTSEEVSFNELVKKNTDKEMSLTVYNSKTDSLRDTVLVPSASWGGPGLIGVTIRFSTVKGANELVWHVLDVYPNSPAAAAGFEPYNDYVVGNTERIFSGPDDFFNLVQSSIGRPVQLFVYNVVTDEVRVLTITPNKDWGGNGTLGCDIGFGLLHRIPLKAEEVAQAKAHAAAMTAKAQKQSEHLEHCEYHDHRNHDHHEHKHDNHDHHDHDHHDHKHEHKHEGKKVQPPATPGVVAAAGQPQQSPVMQSVEDVSGTVHDSPPPSQSAVKPAATTSAPVVAVAPTVTSASVVAPSSPAASSPATSAARSAPVLPPTVATPPTPVVAKPAAVPVTAPPAVATAAPPTAVPAKPAATAATVAAPPAAVTPKATPPALPPPNAKLAATAPPPLPPAAATPKTVTPAAPAVSTVLSAPQLPPAAASPAASGISTSTATTPTTATPAAPAAESPQVPSQLIALQQQQEALRLRLQELQNKAKKSAKS